jgi:hypothetical protein
MIFFPLLSRFNLKNNSQKNIRYNYHKKTLSEGSFLDNENNIYILKLLNPEIFKSKKKKK